MSVSLSIKMTPESERSLERAFEKIGAALSGQALETALVAGALNIQNYAKEHAAYKTGTLRRSIHIGGHSGIVAGFGQGGGYSDIGGNEHGDTFARVWVGTNLVYARRIEYGFIGADKLGRVYNQRPRPYLRPAFDTQGPAVERDFERAITQLLADI